ncbi:hypothetical protein [Streptomyces spiramenti]|uniref:DUF4190 domain-containing protein n=1 Tax=Streptomyces spiramenti TaxID=2720606 RepID=A0ABX1AMX1_9ACTN|nr:hypothetical protein [Streptomyces spiramenti]NJP67046.1 hypothetical protein [Streptomyces spiramenti]
MNKTPESEPATDLPAVHRWARTAALVGLLLVPDVYGAALLSAAPGVCALVKRSRTTEPLFRAFLVGCQLFVLLYAFSGAAD